MGTETRRARAILGLAAGGIVTAAALYAITRIDAWWQGDRAIGADAIPRALLYTGMFAVFTVPLALLLGPPAGALLRRLRCLNPVSGGVVGALGCALLAFGLGATLHGHAARDLDGALLFGLAGFAGGGVAARLAGRAR